MQIKAWIEAARLRTLPLAAATMIVGHALAATKETFSWTIALLSIGTALSMQILSNLANDYGDSIHGADHADRKGPSRMVQSGTLQPSQMKRAMNLWSLISFVTGVILVFYAFDEWVLRTVFILLGLIAIWAAINYTSGDKPYGYSGKGDISVFIFFGLVTVLGSYFLQTKSFDWSIVLPAIACGALSTGVLNVNNIRDIESDKVAGKQSIPVKIGRSAAVKYHAVLLILGISGLVGYGIWHQFGWSPKWLFLLSLPLFLINFRAVRSINDPIKLDPYLKQLALSITLTLILFSIALHVF